MPPRLALANVAGIPGAVPAAPELPRIAPYFTLDAWRGMAALWVVMLHACLPFIANGHQSLLRNPLYWVSIWGQLGVTVFFVISGYCIVGAAYTSLALRKPVTRFWADRIRRIYPPYLAALLLQAVAVGVTASLQSHHFLPRYNSGGTLLPATYASWLANVTLTQLPLRQPLLLIVAWSLCYEVCFYVAVGFLLGTANLLGRRYPAQRLAVLVAGIGLLTCGSLAWLCLSFSTCPFPLDLWYPFGLGSLLFLCFATSAEHPGAFRKHLRTLVLFAVGLALLLTACFGVLHTGHLSDAQPTLGHPSARVQAMAALVFFGLLYLLRPLDGLSARHWTTFVFRRLGAFSYSIYLVHVILLPYTDAGLRKIGFTRNWYLVTYVMQILIGVTAGWIFFLLIERNFISGRQSRRIQSE